MPHVSLLLVAACVGYAIMMATNPVRSNFRDGLRAIRRYQTLWLTLGTFGFCYALFLLVQRLYFHQIAPPETRPMFLWARSAWRDPDLWLSGSPESLWFLPRADFLAILHESLFATLDSLAAIFNCVVATFPVSAFAAVVLLINWNGHHGVLIRALQKRFGRWGWAIHGAIVLCAIAALLKPLLYLIPPLFHTHGPSALLWFQWAPVVVALASLFEYLFGVCIQIYLILIAYSWVRGISFTPPQLLDFAIRRFSSVVKWAALVLFLSTLCIELPLVLKNFPAFADWFPEEQLFTSLLRNSRAALSAFLILNASMQITLTFHSESLGKALKDHLRFIRDHAWPLFWYVIIAAVHLYALHVADFSLRKGLGEGTAAWVLWSLIFPWLAALVSAWMLASWVSVYKRCGTGSTQDWIPHTP